MAVVAAAHAPRGSAAETPESFVDIIRPPDFAAAYVEGSGRIKLSRSADRWQAEDVEVTTEAKQLGKAKSLALSVASPRRPLELLFEALV